VAVVGLIYGAWFLLILGVLVIVAATAMARTVRQGRNPWWMRAPLDKRPPRP
jgi:hypothetical protein